MAVQTPSSSSASSEDFLQPSDLAHDGDTNSYWSTLTSITMPQWIRLDYAAAFELTGYTYTPNSNSSRNAADFEIQGSNDGTSWTTEHSVTGFTGTSPQFYSVTGSASWSMYRMYVTAHGGGTSLRVNELVLEGDTAPTIPTGSGAGEYGWTGAATGTNGEIPSGVGAGNYGWTGTATGDNGEGSSGSGSGTYGWTGEAHGVAPIPEQDTRPIRTQISLGYLVVPTAAEPPAGVAPIAVTSYSHQAPAPTAELPVITRGLDYTDPAPVTVGTPHVFIDGVDCTYLGGAPILAKRWSRRRPLASTGASFEVPAMQAWHKAGEGDYAALRPDAPVELTLIRPDATRVHLWSGFLSEDAATVGENKTRGFTADGTLWQAGYARHEPPHYLPPTDIGILVARSLNGVEGKRWEDVPERLTGILTRFRGSDDMSVMQYVNELLARAWTDDGRQWTLDELAPRFFDLILKPASGYDWTVTYGAFGVEVDLSRDESMRVDVIYGKGVEPNGGQWRGTRFPGLVIATPPPYPNNDASSLHLGDSDADTDSGTGVSDWQRRMVELGYSLNVDGVLNSLDIQVVYRLQARMGLLEDGVIGPQTWAGSFNRGPEGIDLTQWREPIAALPWTQPKLRDPNGIILGDNPAWAGESRVPHPHPINFGTDITWQQAQPLAERILAVESQPGLTGRIRLRTDPWEGWKGEIREGDRIRVVGFQGEDIEVTVAAFDAIEDEDGLEVTLTVDERSRDAMNVAAILERNREALPDLARKPGNPARDSRTAQDRYVQWDIDSPCGWLPRTAVFGGLWVAPNPIPFAEVGRIVKVMLTSTVPFTIALFGLPVKPSQMHAIVGNPHAQDRPWSDEDRVIALDRLGWIDSWGSQGQRCGYSPGQESEGDPFTGKWEDRGGFDYISGRPPYVWPLLYSDTTGFIGGADGEYGRFYPGTYL